MKNFLLLHHPKLPRSLALAEAWADRFAELGARATIISAWDDAEILRQLPTNEMAITLGGDGTVLRTARLCAPSGMPIFSVKMGRVGFLSEVEPDQFDATVLVEDKFCIE